MRLKIGQNFVDEKIHPSSVHTAQNDKLNVLNSCCVSRVITCTCVSAIVWTCVHFFAASIMGVLPFKNSRTIINMETSLLQLQEQFPWLADVIGDLPTPVESSRRRRIRRRTRNHDMQSARARFEEEINELRNTQRRLNSRRMRRHENTRMLLNLFDPDDIHFDVCIDDFAEYQSVFSQLFTDSEKMQVSGIRLWRSYLSKFSLTSCLFLYGIKLWNNFVEMSEEEQAAILNSQDARYANVDSRMKATLGVGNLYADQLEAFECELTEHFTKLPKVKCVKWVKLSSDRMLLHAVSQWLFLKSRSRNKAGKRITTVTNPRCDFVAPKMTLAAYLKEKNEC
ncbi:R3H domain-containing protein 4 [Trichinella murrelli]|uniref:R3H domain-containing protein 4 n=1 Tax=Trichinella murrelli TaxID=144512 RepID=A0A0V0UAX5_9BILA|nr:R3H domain-containing protein 4 [Trichinella murrelli]